MTLSDRLRNVANHPNVRRLSAPLPSSLRSWLFVIAERAAEFPTRRRSSLEFATRRELSAQRHEVLQHGTAPWGGVVVPQLSTSNNPMTTQFGWATGRSLTDEWTIVSVDDEPPAEMAALLLRHAHGLPGRYAAVVPLAHRPDYGLGPDPVTMETTDTNAPYALLRNDVVDMLSASIDAPRDLPEGLRTIRENGQSISACPTRCSSGPDLVSVITRTTGTRPELLAQAMASVANQTHQSLEHIIVHDGESPPPSFTTRHARFLSITRSGRSAAGNTGLADAAGSWCLFLDDDDLLLPTAIEELLEAAIRADAGGAVSRAWRVYDEHGLESGHKVTHPLFSSERLATANIAPIQAVLFRRELFDQYGGFRDLDAFEDWNLWLRYNRAKPFVPINRALSLYREPRSLADRVRARRRMADRFRIAQAQNDRDLGAAS